MTTINDITDLVRILRERPEWTETVRNVLLSRELLELPQRFAEYAAATDRRLEALEAGQVRLEQALTQFMDSTNRRLEALEAGQQELRDGQQELQDRQKALEIGQQEIRRDLAPLKGAHARSGALQATRRIARTLNCRQLRLLNDDELYDLLVNSGPVDDIQQGDRRSFENADIVIMAEHRETGETHYIAVEASFTAHEDDTRRALRNAGYLTRFTGQPAHAVVAAVFVDPTVASTFAGGQVHWYEIERRIPGP